MAIRREMERLLVFVVLCSSVVVLAAVMLLPLVVAVTMFLL